jgi:hypothetical protein
VDLRGPNPNWTNIPLEKITVPLSLKSALLLCVLIFLSALLIWPLTFVVWLIRARNRPSQNEGKGRLPKVARPLAAIVAALDVVLIYLLLTRLSFLIHYGFPWSIRLPLDSKVEFVALLVSCGLAPLLPLLTVLVWKRACWDRLQRVHYALVAMAGLFVNILFFAWKLPKWPF